MTQNGPWDRYMHGVISEIEARFASDGCHLTYRGYGVDYGNGKPAYDLASDPAFATEHRGRCSTWNKMMRCSQTSRS